MSTSATVYNLKTKTKYYIDNAYWLTDVPAERLLTGSELWHKIAALLFDPTLDERGHAWLSGLSEWILSNSPHCSMMVVYDNSEHEFYGLHDEFQLFNP